MQPIILRRGKEVGESKPKDVVVSTPNKNHVEEKRVEEQKTKVEATKKAPKPYSIAFPDNLPILKPQEV